MKKIIWFFLKISFLFGLIFIVFLTINFYQLIKELPSFKEITLGEVTQSTKIFDRSGEILLYKIYKAENRTIVPFEEIPEYLKLATIAVEDDNFYQHPAVDWRAITRAFLTNIVKGRIVQGGSTITQQLVKNALIGPEKTVRRKLKEMILAIQLEQRYSKDEILSFYLNQIPYGSNIYGVEEASQAYFKKPVRKINLAEAAILAALPKAPTYYSPWGYHQEELKNRQKFILGRMFYLGFIDEQELNEAKNKKIVFASPTIPIKAPHFVMEVKQYLVQKYGQEIVKKGGLRIFTTLDYELQKIAEKAVEQGAIRNERLYQGKNAALVAQDVKTGQILALVGSRDYFDIENEGNFNVASQGLRQPGSALKPFVYLAAFERGYTPETMVFDVKTEFETSGIQGRSYQPENFDQIFRGPVTFKEALAQSINVPSVKVLYLTGLTRAGQILEKFGLTTIKNPEHYGLSLVLGGPEVKLTEMVGAYSTLANYGAKIPQTMILRIEDSQGNILEEYSKTEKRVFEENYVKLINNILADHYLRAPLFGASASLVLFENQEIALKTGTSDDFRDAWAIGYTPSLVVGVWAGNNDSSPLRKEGGSILAALPIWHNFFKEIAEFQPKKTFLKPSPIFTENPILRGEFPEIRSILFYLDKNNPLAGPPLNPSSDPQFENWERGVLEWAKENIADFSKKKTNENPRQGKIEILGIAPASGDFLKTPFKFKAEIKSSLELSKIELYLNEKLINYIPLSGKKEYNYSFQITQELSLQNLIKIKVFDISGASKEKEIIVFLNQ